MPPKKDERQIIYNVVFQNSRRGNANPKAFEIDLGKAPLPLAGNNLLPMSLFIYQTLFVSLHLYVKEMKVK